MRLYENDGSCEIGNVSYACPAIHAAFAIQSGKWVNHTPGFADAAHTLDAFNRALACSKGLAAVGYDVLTNDAVAAEVEAAFKGGVNKKAAEISRYYEVTAPTEKPMNQLAAALQAAAVRLLLPTTADEISLTREQALGALMASDDLDRLKELL